MLAVTWEMLGAILIGSFGLYHGYNAFMGTGSYFDGLQLGYNYELPSKVVFGVTTDGSFPNTVAGVQTFTSPSTGQASFGETVEYSGTLRGRVGYAIGDRLLYATGGLAWSDDRFTRTQVAGPPVGGTSSHRCTRASAGQRVQVSSSR
jgi:high affinity Mn2+ porin